MNQVRDGLYELRVGRGVARREGDILRQQRSFMNIRWLWGNYIEPEWKLSRAEVRTVHRLVKQKHMRPAALYGMTAISLSVAYAMYSLARYVAFVYLQLWWSLAVTAACVLATVVISLWCFRMVYTRPVRRAMRDLGYDVCISCGYWLRGLDDATPRCPECGADREAMPESDG
jgi:hypothetical protein